jgi:hypothetical protein
MTVFQTGVYILVESLRQEIIHVTLHMSFRKAAILLAFCSAWTLVWGCSSAPKATRSTATPASVLEIEHIKSALSMASDMAHTLYVEGDITFEHDGESNNASFVMRSKRLQGKVRIDSLSLEVKGPFGIKVARFMASPAGYQMYDILHGETMHGKTDAHTLESITQMKGLSLAMMGDLAYGLSPDMVSSADDAVEMVKVNGNPIIDVWHPSADVTERVHLIASTNGDSYKLSDYFRFSGKAPASTDASSADIRIHFAQHQVIDGFPIPKHIEVVAGTNKLVMDYTKINLNPEPLTVKIKMPSE